MPMVKLIYFAAEGRGELTRILLNIGAYNACMHGKNATEMCQGHYQLKRLVYSKVVLGPKLLLVMGCVKLGEKNCVQLPSVGEQNAN